mmetsp:Transcript_29182/g.69674  ORF Transcript_29182/g.69674 Transcript_29182/m.69674 type:complete len:101 (-) Transcript_29182:112-414(-)
MAHLRDDSHSHEDKLSLIRGSSAVDATCAMRMQELTKSSSATAAAVRHLTELGTARGLSSRDIERIVHRLVAADEDAETAMRNAFAAMFMAEPSRGFRAD